MTPQREGVTTKSGMKTREKRLEAYAATPNGVAARQSGAWGVVENFAAWVWPDRVAVDRRKLGLGARRKWPARWFCERLWNTDPQGMTREGFFAALDGKVSRATFARAWARLVRYGFIDDDGRARGARWRVNANYMRDGLPDFALIDYDDHGRTLTERADRAALVGSTEPPAVGRKPKHTVEALLLILADRSMRPADFCREVCAETEMSASTFWALLRRAADAGLVHRTPSGLWEVARIREPAPVEIDL